MTAKSFVDTNVLVYAYDDGDRAKRDQARELVRAGIESGLGVISTQIMQEFYSAVTRKKRMPPLEAKTALREMDGFEIVTINPTLVLEAVDNSILNQLSFWDALVLTTAAAAECGTLYSEDLQHGQTILGVRIVNPFQIPTGTTKTKRL